MSSNNDKNVKVYFSKYKTLKKIGEGSFGKIYSAINISNNDRLAMKMVIYLISTIFKFN